MTAVRPPLSAADVIARFRAGQITAADMMAAIRAAVLLVPVVEPDRVWVGTSAGMGWLCAFTTTKQLARFARARGEGDREWSFARVRGERLLGPLLRGLGCVCGVALDVAGPQPMLLPPLRGVVDDDLALPTTAAQVEGRVTAAGGVQR